MDIKKKKIAAFDLDGTITQHRTPVSDEHLALLTKMAEKYKILMVGAGMCDRIFHQLREFPVDIIGCYGMQFCEYDKTSGGLKTVYFEHKECDKESVCERARAICDRHGYTDQKGELVCFHASGAVTIALLGTDADIEDKLKFDPDKKSVAHFITKWLRLFPITTCLWEDRLRLTWLRSPTTSFLRLTAIAVTTEYRTTRLFSSAMTTAREETTNVFMFPILILSA